MCTCGRGPGPVWRVKGWLALEAHMCKDKGSGQEGSVFGCKDCLHAAIAEEAAAVLLPRPKSCMQQQLAGL